jgi:hypothetical protein
MARSRYRDLDELLDDEEELAKAGLVEHTRELIDTTAAAVDKRVRNNPIGTTLISAAALYLLLGRRRGRARKSVLLPLLLRFASSTAVGAVLGRAARTKSLRYFL